MTAPKTNTTQSAATAHKCKAARNNPTAVRLGSARRRIRFCCKRFEMWNGNDGKGTTLVVPPSPRDSARARPQSRRKRLEIRQGQMIGKGMTSVVPPAAENLAALAAEVSLLKIERPAHVKCAGRPVDCLGLTKGWLLYVTPSVNSGSRRKLPSPGGSNPKSPVVVRWFLEQPP